MVYNKCIKYLRDKYGENWEKMEMPQEDKGLLLLVHQYYYGLSVKAELALKAEQLGII